MNNWLFFGFSRIFLLGILIFKGLTALHLYISRSALKVNCALINPVKTDVNVYRV
jgi:hypothetical protein